MSPDMRELMMLKDLAQRMSNCAVSVSEDFSRDAYRFYFQREVPWGETLTAGMEISRLDLAMQRREGPEIVGLKAQAIGLAFDKKIKDKQSSMSVKRYNGRDFGGMTSNIADPLGESDALTFEKITTAIEAMKKLEVPKTAPFSPARGGPVTKDEFGKAIRDFLKNKPSETTSAKRYSEPEEDLTMTSGTTAAEKFDVIKGAILALNTMIAEQVGDIEFANEVMTRVNTLDGQSVFVPEEQGITLQRVVYSVKALGICGVFKCDDGQEFYATPSDMEDMVPELSRLIDDGIQSITPGVTLKDLDKLAQAVVAGKSSLGQALQEATHQTLAVASEKAATKREEVRENHYAANPIYGKF